MLGHEEIRTIVQALACGIGAQEFDISKLRYGKIVIMTDADVDGSHIRTLLLTFFFRQMAELIRQNRIYIAQPPLYKVTRKRQVEYVKNEGVMRKTLADLGLDGTSLIIRDKKGGEKIRYKGADLRKAMGMLEQVEDMGRIAERRGMPLQRLVDLRKANGKLPVYRVILDGKENLFYEQDDYERFVEKNKVIELETQSKLIYVEGNGEVEDEKDKEAKKNIKKQTKGEMMEIRDAARRRLERNEELHEMKEIEKLLVKLTQMELPIEDWFLKVEETDSGEKLMTRYAVESGEEFKRDIAGLGEIVPTIHEIAKEGISEVKRFKGLGEMNAEELWMTTMDPARRTLLRVTLESASKAEAMFSTLMGENVERRREFIEAHALDVKNLDV
jgi:DNA gyrase subunit B